MRDHVVLTGSDLNIDDVAWVARERIPVSVDPVAMQRIREARAVIERALARGETVYGLTTGVGARTDMRVVPEDVVAFNRRLIDEHRVGAGPLVAPEVVRATMLALANQFARGYAGVRIELVELLVHSLNHDRTPRVRSQGSIGQADLAPMADLAAGVIDGFELAAGEGLALLDTNAFSTASAALALRDATTLLAAAELAGTASLDAFGANLDLLHPEVASARPVPDLRATVERLRAHLKGSRLWDLALARNLQDPLSFRTIPQVLAAGGNALASAREQVAAELNASQGNPIVIVKEDRLASVGNFDASALAIALDLARIALATVLTTSAERTIKLLDSPWSGLPTGLAADDGSAGLSMLAIASLSFTAEARLLAHPTSFELASSSLAAGIEDRTSLAPLGARRLDEMVGLGCRVVAAEIAVAARAATLRDERPFGVGTERAIALVCDHAPVALDGIPPDLTLLADAVRSGGAS